MAKDLLGSLLVRCIGNSVLSGKIVETEAYRGADDPASHAYRGVTKRNEVMFGEAGHAYIYFTYGNHYCLNFTTEGEAEAGAVLIRAIEPVRGTAQMQKRRGIQELTELASGPGKLTKAMAIDKSLNGEDLVTSKHLYVLRGDLNEEVGISSRIGLSVARETKWRYFVEGSPFVSGGRIHNYRRASRGERGVVG